MALVAYRLQWLSCGLVQRHALLDHHQVATLALDTGLAKIEIALFFAGVVASESSVEPLPAAVASKDLALLNELPLGRDPDLGLVLQESDNRVSLTARQIGLSLL